MNIWGFLVKPRKVTWWLLVVLMTGYLLLCTIVFFHWINPSLDGRTDQHIAADSTTYIYMADTLRDGRRDPWVLAALASFPNNLWVPVFIALALNSTVLVALFNLALLWISIELFRRSSKISVGLFLFLLLLNATTTISLLSVNKEIVDLFIMALFCYFWANEHKWPLALPLMLSLLNRFEVCVVLLAFLAANSRVNPFRNRRMLTLFFLILGLNFFMPLFVSRMLSLRFGEASQGRLIVLLDTLEMHYLFVFAVFPKILENLFGEILNLSTWTGGYHADDFANTYVLFFNNLASLIVIVVLVWKRSLSISSDWIYLASFGAIIISISLIVQPRYFYFCFVLLCFQAAQLKVAQPQTIRERRPVRSIFLGEKIADV